MDFLYICGVFFIIETSRCPIKGIVKTDEKRYNVNWIIIWRCAI